MKGNIPWGNDFPLVCESCLGDHRFLRMIKISDASVCKLSARVFHPFRWRSSNRKELKQTIICYEVAAEKNICQCCLNDIDFNIPIALREKFQNIFRKNKKNISILSADKNLSPTSDLNKAWSLNQRLLETKADPEENSNTQTLSLIEDAQKARIFLKSTSSVQELPQLCRNWLNANCENKNCSLRPCCGIFSFPELSQNFSHEKLKLIEELKFKGPKLVQVPDDIRNILLHSGTTVFDKNKNQSIMPPKDETITTLLLTNVPMDQTYDSLHQILIKFGNIIKISHIKKKKCAFIEFEKRLSAENCIKELGGKILFDNRIHSDITWAKKRTIPNILTSKNLDGNESFNSEDSILISNFSKKRKLEYNHCPLKGTSLPQIMSGVPIPYRFQNGKKLPDNQIEFVKSFIKFTSLDLKGKEFQPPPLSAPSLTSNIFPEKIYPSLNHVALEGNLCLFED